MIRESIVSYLIVDCGFAYDKHTLFFNNPSFEYDDIPNEYLIGNLTFKSTRWLWIDHDEVDVDLMIEVRELCK